MDRRDFLRATACAGAAWLPFRRAWAAEQAGVNLEGKPIVLPQSDIADLAASMQGSVLLPVDSRYEQVRRVWNGSIDKRPALIASCVGAADVMRAVNFAREHMLLTAVRAGGHSTSGKSTCDGGIMIDLSPMRGVRVDPASRTAYLEPGTLLGQLDRECTAFGLATTAGTVSNTGAAGLTLGGGFGRLGSRFGLACDNLKGADVITASGALVHTNESENPELLWGLRGGGGNFGVVTSLEYRLHPMNPIILGGILNWSFEHAREVLEVYAEYAPRKPDELCIDLFLRSAPGGKPGVSMVVCWSADHAAAAFGPIQDLARKAQGTIAPTPYVRLQSIFDGGFPDGRKYYQKSGLVSALTPRAIDELLDVFRAPRSHPLTMQLQGMGGAAHRVKPDATAFFHREALWDMALITSWDDPDPEVSDAYIAGMRAVWKEVEPLTSGFYVNSRHEDDQNAFHENYGSNYPRLVELKNRYDPMNLFRLNANVAPSVGV